jgi:hypothetical protein
VKAEAAEGSRDDVSARATPEGVVDPALGTLLTWVILALLNQLLIAVLLPGTGLGVALQHRAFDAGQFLAAAAASFVAVRGFTHLEARVPWLRPWYTRTLGLALVALAIVWLTIPNDLANYAERTDQTVESVRRFAAPPLACAVALVFVLGRFARGWLRLGFAAAGAALATANALIIPEDYLGLHLLAALISVLLLSSALVGLPLRHGSRRLQWVAFGIVAICGVGSLLAVPSETVRRRLYRLPSSALAPFVTRAPATNREGSRIPESIRNSPWFRSREKLPPIAATPSLSRPKPNVVLFFTIDAFRASLLTDRKTAKAFPNLNALRKKSAYFVEARSPASSTDSTMASIFSGRYISSLEWNPDKTSPERLIDPALRFPELLTKAGVSTLLISGRLGRIFGGSGIPRGFQREINVTEKKKPGKFIVDKVIERLDAGVTGPLFIFAHFIEPHGPYTLAGTHGTPFQRYVREAQLVDKELGRLLARIKELGLENNVSLIISADHGEGFGEHGTYNHAKTIYEELVRVPLIVHLPATKPREFTEPAAVIDAGPTILDLFGVETPGTFMGQSLVPLLTGDAESLSRPIGLDTGRQIQSLCFRNGLKVIHDLRKGTLEVYDLKRDPRERNNLVESGRDDVETAIAATELFFEVHRWKGTP